MALKDGIETVEQAAVEAAKQKVRKENERKRVRAKFSEQDRKRIDYLLSEFEGSRLVAVTFDDGETIGEML